MEAIEIEVPANLWNTNISYFSYFPLPLFFFLLIYFCTAQIESNAMEEEDDCRDWGAAESLSRIWLPS